MTKPLARATDYTEFLSAIKARIRSARISAVRSVNKELITLYWSIGKDIVEKQAQLGWGKSVVEQLSRDLKNEFPGTDGFSVQNLWYMRQFYTEYQDHLNLQQLVGEIPWGQNILILQMIKDANPSIGIILCANRDHFEVEYALRGIQKPVGVAEYKLTTKLPKKLEGKLPDARTLKHEILKELKG